MFTLPEFIVPKTVAEARNVQEAMRRQVRLSNDFGDIKTIAGVDVGYDTARDLAHASIAVLSAENLDTLEAARAFAPALFPYVPGFLSFREIPAILAALAELKRLPDLLMVDGQGIAHPRRLGIAAHLGVLLDMPSVGVAKSCLCGTYTEPGMNKGDMTKLLDGSEQIGIVLRSKDRVKPLFISPGNRVDIPTSVALVMRCLTRYRLPEPTRLADKFSKVKKEPVLV